MKGAERVGIIVERDYLLHRVPQSVREDPVRLLSLYQRLEDSNVIDQIRRYPARTALEAEILNVHSEMYIEQIRRHSIADNPFAYDKDTYLMEDSYYVATLAAGGCLTLADAIMAGELHCGFALVRPPGHHAGVGNGSGFCILNNIAIVADHLKRQYGLKRVLIFDFDAHHGNGTEEIFWEDPSVCVLSIHENNLFPKMSGDSADIGGGPGRGYNVNIPVFPTFGDIEYTYIVGNIVHNAIRLFAPEFILVSAGFDGHIDDPISSLSLSTAWYGRVARILKSYSRTYGIDRLLFVLEGGYNRESMVSAALSTIEGLYLPAETMGIPFSERAANLLNKTVLPHLPHRCQASD
jgi:acetoin utilization deacetylase AcuC-like enzyme